MTQAEAAANYVRHFFPDGHHGAYEKGDQIIIYGHDHYSTDARARQTAERMKRIVLDYEITVCEFGVSDDRVAWAIVATPDANHIVDADDLHAEVGICWLVACEEDADESKRCFE